jgi:predicted ATPase/DNA-binding SARP family transcriptional activator
MQFSVLGPVEVTDGAAPLPLGGPRQSAVLALLLLDPGRTVDADRILTEIWGDIPPDGARDSLYTYISNLRRVLGRERVVRADRGYRLELTDGDTVDVARFEADLEDAHRWTTSDPASVPALVDRALGAWRGRPYEGLEDLPAVVPEAARLAELRLRGLEDRAEAELRTGGTPDVAGLEMMTADHPYRERCWELLARALYRTGRQAESLRALTRLRRLLVDDLGIDPSPAIARLEERILLQDPGLDANTAPPTNLPATVSSFIGRIDEIDALERRVADHRLVTLAGPGGAGKTRLAVEVAGRIAAGFPDGVWFCDLAPVDGSQVVPTVAAAIGAAGAADVQAIAEGLRGRTTLLVLDNCEHVTGPVGDLVARFLAGSPDLRILVTSRRVLEVPGEAVAPLLGLGLTSDDPNGGDAERLFTARARSVRPTFDIDVHRSDVETICRHLDGMPLAIELAAARVDALSPAEIVRHLEQRLRLLADTHAERTSHRSLEASLDWSRDLLDPQYRRAFDRLGVFEGSFTASAAATVLEASTEIDALDALRQLVGASLVQTRSGDTTRYRLLETTRLFARERLRASDSWQDVVDRHDAHFSERCRELRPAFFGSGRPEACRAIEAEFPDHDVSFERFLEADVGTALDMAWALANAWLFSGRISVGIDRVEPLIARTSGLRTGPRADALAAGTFLIMYANRYDTAIDWADEAIGIYRSLGDEQGLAYALARRGHLAFSVGDVPGAIELLQESLDTCELIGYQDGTAWPLTLLGQARLWGGDEGDEVVRMLDEGRLRFIAVGDTFGQMHANMFRQNVGDRGPEVGLRIAEESLELSQRPGADPLMRPVVLHNLAFGVWHTGDRDRAMGQNRLSARAALETGATVSSGMAFLQAGLFAGMSGDPDRAAILYGAGDRHFVMAKAPFYERQLRPGIDAAIEALGEERYRHLRDEGAAMTVAEATDYLLRSG